jgi:uncharacterized FlgJ-related protein
LKISLLGDFIHRGGPSQHQILTTIKPNSSEKFLKTHSFPSLAKYLVGFMVNSGMGNSETKLKSTSNTDKYAFDSCTSRRKEFLDSFSEDTDLVDK